MKNKLIKSFKKPIFIIIIVTLIVSSILLFDKILYSDDIYFHISRIMFVRDKILSLNLSNIYYFYGYGYGEGFFYPDFFLYMPAVFNIFIDNIIVYKIFILIINFCSIFTMYYCTKKITNSKNIGIICSIIYGFLPFRLSAIYISSQLGVAMAYIFFPIVIYSFFEIINGKNKYILLALSMSAVILSHLLSSCILFFFLLMILLFNIKNVKKNKKILLYLFYSSVITIALTAFFTFPMFEQILDQKFRFAYAGSDIHIYDRSLSIIDLFTEFNYFIPSKNYIPPGIGIVLSTILLIFIINIKKCQNNTKIIFVVAFIGLIFTTNIFPWRLFESYLKIFQFPWRLLAIVTTLFVFGTAFLLKDMKITKFKYRYIILFITLLLTSFITIINIINIYIKKDSLSYYRKINNEYLYSIAWGEYLPINYNIKNIFYGDSYTIKYNNFKINSRYNFKYNILFSNNIYQIYFYDNKKLHNYIELPIIYYKGYKILVNGKPVKIIKNKNGLIGMNLNSKKGKIIVYYSGTFIQSLSTIISMLCIMFLVVVKYVSWSDKNEKIK